MTTLDYLREMENDQEDERRHELEEQLDAEYWAEADDGSDEHWNYRHASLVELVEMGYLPPQFLAE